MHKDERFPKYLRIKSKKIFEQLAASNNKLLHYPILLKWFVAHNGNTEKPAVQVGFSVSKRRLKKAVKRNKIKRRLKEAFRKNKNLLPINTPGQNSLYLLFVYLSDKEFDYNTINLAIRDLLKNLTDTLSNFKQNS